MRFSDYLNNAWHLHNSATQSVVEGFKEGVSLIEHPGDVAQMAALVTHLLGQHLGRFDQAIQTLSNLKTHSQFAGDSVAAVARSLAALRLASNQTQDLGEFSASDQTRVYALASSILSERDTAQAREFLVTAMSIAASALEKDDPAVKSLAAQTHNIAAALEVKKTLSEDEERLMLEAATASRKYWEIVGTWIEVKQGEYRLASSCIKAKKWEEAKGHAHESLRLCEENKGSAMEYFFAYEILALVAKATQSEVEYQDASSKARGHYAQLTLEDKKYCEESLQNLK